MFLDFSLLICGLWGMKMNSAADHSFYSTLQIHHPLNFRWEFAYALCMMVFWYAFYSQRLLLKVAKNRILTDIQKCSFFSPFSWFWSWISLSLISPHSGSKKLVLAAEVQIYCIQSRKAAVAQELKFSLRSGFSSMLGEFLYLEELCK